MKVFFCCEKQSPSHTYGKFPYNMFRHSILRPQLHDTGSITHRITLSYTAPRQSSVTPFCFPGVKPLLFGGEVKVNPIHSAPHSISCNCTNPMWSHSSWASQLSKTIDLGITVQCRVAAIKSEFMAGNLV